MSKAYSMSACQAKSHPLRKSNGGSVWQLWQKKADVTKVVFTTYLRPHQGSAGGFSKGTKQIGAHASDVAHVVTHIVCTSQELFEANWLCS